MRYFPIFFDLDNRPVTVVGGTEEALRKIRLLLKTGAVINVIAPDLHEELAAERRVNWVARGYHAGLIEGAALVYSADAALNERVASDARAMGIPVNAVDNPDISTFIVPSIVDRDPVVVAIGGHHQPESAMCSPLVSLMHVAEVLSNALDLAGRQENRVTYLSAMACKNLGLVWADDIKPLFGRIEARSRHMNAFFSMPHPLNL